MRQRRARSDELRSPHPLQHRMDVPVGFDVATVESSLLQSEGCNRNRTSFGMGAREPDAKSDL